MKTIVITGATSGIGLEAALFFLKQGHTVISNTRNAQKSEKLHAELIEKSDDKNLYFYSSDFSDFSSVKNFSDQVIKNHPAIDILINNAGTWEIEFKETKDGIETNFQVNHLSPMLLTLRLLPALEKTENARIINTSSMAHRRDVLQLDDLEFRNSTYDGIFSYSQSKLCNILFSLELIDILKDKNITVNTVHPGYVKTQLFEKMGQRSWAGVPDAADGARSTVYAALSDDLKGISGKYIYHEHEEEPTEKAKNKNLADVLWEKSLVYIKNYL